MLARRCSIGGIFLVSAALSCEPASGQQDQAYRGVHFGEAPSAARPRPGLEHSAGDAPEQVAMGPEEILSAWIAEAIPTAYEKKDDWGKTAPVIVGLDTRRRGLRLRIRKKEKDVPHGIWKHYRIVMPEASDVPRVDVEELQAVEPGRAAAIVRVAAPLEAWARTRIYQRGVHLGTYTAEGSARVHVRLACELGVRLDGSEGWPVLIVSPEVRTARVDLHEFRLRRISDADGPFVRELGRVVKLVMEEELEPHKLTRKLNRAIEKKRDRLRFDAGDLAAEGWQDLLEAAAAGASR